MRFAKTCVLLAALVPLVGCETFRWGLFRRDDPTPPPGALPSADQLVAYLNDNSQRIRSLSCTDIDLTAQQRFQSFGLRGKMMAMKPRGLVMNATAFGSPVVDLGSNSDEFWFWFSKGEPYQFFCTYKDYEEGRVAKLPFPFQPDWVLEGLGMGSFGSADKYTIESDAKTVRLVERTRSPQGQPVRKVIVMNRREARAPNPQVQAYLLFDETTNKEICSVHVHETKIDDATGAIVPRKMDVRWPTDNAKLTFTFNQMQVNPVLEEAQFQRRPMQGVPAFDLARTPASGVSRVRGAAP